MSNDQGAVLSFILCQEMEQTGSRVLKNRAIGTVRIGGGHNWPIVFVRVDAIAAGSAEDTTGLMGFVFKLTAAATIGKKGGVLTVVVDEVTGSNGTFPGLI